MSWFNTKEFINNGPITSVFAFNNIVLFLLLSSSFQTKEKLVNLSKETVVSWLDDSTVYKDENYYSVSECAPLIKESTFYLTKDGQESFSIKHATVGKTILRVTTTDSTGIVYEGYIVFMENYKTGIRYQFAYMVERSLFEEDRDLDIAQSIMLLDN